MVVVYILVTLSCLVALIVGLYGVYKHYKFLDAREVREKEHQVQLREIEIKRTTSEQTQINEINKELDKMDNRISQVTLKQGAIDRY